MPKYMVFDIETTGLDVQTAKVLELGYILWNSETRESTHGKMYFNTDDEVPYKAAAVNGLSKHKLQMLSNGCYFEDRLEEIKKVFHSADVLVGHNIEAYDLPIVKNNCIACGDRLSRSPDGTLKTWKTYDTLIHSKGVLDNGSQRGAQFRGRYYGPKLKVAYASVCNKVYRQKPSDLDALFTRDYGTVGQAHEALYDVWMTFVVFRGLLMLGK